LRKQVGRLRTALAGRTRSTGRIRLLVGSQGPLLTLTALFLTCHGTFLSLSSSSLHRTSMGHPLWGSIREDTWSCSA
jgi:hypothetical protein